MTKIIIAILTFLLGIFAASLLPSEKKIVDSSISPVPFNYSPPVKPQLPAGKVTDRPVIEILMSFPNGETKRQTIVNPSSRPAILDLGFDNEIDGQIIALRQFQQKGEKFKIEEQFETSMTVNSEGPHHDLTGWKHYVSEWRELEDLGNNSFRALEITEEERSRFPSVSKSEIYDAALKDGGKRWAEVAKDCESANEGPCMVLVNQMRFRISAWIRGKWILIHRLDINSPMGC